MQAIGEVELACERGTDRHETWSRRELDKGRAGDGGIVSASPIRPCASERLQPEHVRTPGRQIPVATISDNH
jgi:hypothetical protein